MSDTKYFHSINWAPWLGFAFLLSGFFFSTVSNNGLLTLFIFLSFLPAIAVQLGLRRYSKFINPQQLTDYFNRATGDSEIESINLNEIKMVRWVGKSVVITQTDGTIQAHRYKNSAAFVEQLRAVSPEISVVTY